MWQVQLQVPWFEAQFQPQESQAPSANPSPGDKWEGWRVEPLYKYNMNYYLYVVSASCVFTLILGCAVVSTVTSHQRRVMVLLAVWGLSVGRLHVHPVPVLVFPRQHGFLPPSKDTQVIKMVIGRPLSLGSTWILTLRGKSADLLHETSMPYVSFRVAYIQWRRRTLGVIDYERFAFCKAVTKTGLLLLLPSSFWCSQLMMFSCLTQEIILCYQSLLPFHSYTRLVKCCMTVQFTSNFTF